MVLHVLHFHYTLTVLGFPNKYCYNISTVISSFSMLLSKNIIDLSKTLNIMLVSCILCQLLDDDQSPTVKYNLSKSQFSIN